MAPFYRFESSFQNVTQTDLASIVPGSTRLDSLTLGYTTVTFPEGYRRSTRMLGLMRLERMRWMSRAVQDRTDAAVIRRKFMDLLVTNWLEPEKLPKPRQPSTPAGKRRYWGDT